MPIQVQCPQCQATLRVPDRAAGKRVKCPKCSSVIAVDPQNDTPETPSISPSSPPRKQAADPGAVNSREKKSNATTATVSQQSHSSRLKWIFVAAGSSVVLLTVAFGAFLAGRTGKPSNEQASTVADSDAPDNANVVRTEASVVAAKTSTNPPPQSSPPSAATNASGKTASASVPPPVTAPASAPTVTASADPPIQSGVGKSPVSFEALQMDEPATSLTVTEDGRFVVFSHQTANLFSVYDISKDRIVKVVSSATPRALLCRGDQLYVGNFGEGTVSVYSISKGWTLENELQVTKPNIVFMSAASGRTFGGEILVTCHDGGNQASYQGSYIYRLDTGRDRCDPVSRSPIASVSYDGKNVLTQGSFNLSPSGGMSVYSWDEFVAGDAKPIFQGGIQQTPFVYQPYYGSYWFSENMIFGGAPIGLTHDKLGQIIVPDTMQKIVYVLDEDLMSARRVNFNLSETDEKPRRIQWPPEYKKEPFRLFHQLERRRSYHLDHPIAVTSGNVLTVLLLDQKNGSVVKARTVPFGIPEQADVPESPVSAVQPAMESKPAVIPNAPETFPQPEAASTPGAVAGLFDGWPALIVAGTQFTHQFHVESSGVGVELLDGPSGMKVSDTGILTWTPTKANVGMHELKVRVSRSSGPYFERPKVEVISEQLAKSVGGDLSKVNQFDTLDLDVDHYALISARDRKSHLLLQGQTLRILGADGVSVDRTVELPQRYHDLEERPDAYVAVSSKPAFIDVVDKKSLKVRKHIELTFADFKAMEVIDLAIHPDQKICFVCVKHSIELPRYTVLFVDEQSGTTTVPGVIGNWAEVSSDGNFLYAGYSDLYEKGIRFHINPDWRLIETPEYGGIDMLLKWDISGKKPALRDIVRQAGGNGNGIRLSSDENRIVYLSHVGTPMHSQNLLGFSTQDFKHPAINYETKGRASTKEAAFHPFLPWVAMPGPASVVIFHQDTGAIIESRLLATLGGLGADPIDRLFFSVDGQAIILIRGGGETGRYLQRIPLILDKSEQDTTRPTRKAPDVAARKRPMVPENELTALATAPADTPVTPLEIGREFTSSVVIIKTPGKSGTGFVVGDNGYVLTCAHVVTGFDAATVAYKVSDDSETFVEGSAAVVEIDEEKDVALLHFKPSRPLKSVRLRSGQQMETGEPVTVIGNPSSGDAVLNHTMTAGIVSNPKRDFDGQDYIQLSAAVNPGNSGGPLFDQYGNVAGLIALKARIEGAGFAVPAETLRQFMKSTTKKR